VKKQSVTRSVRRALSRMVLTLLLVTLAAFAFALPAAATAAKKPAPKAANKKPVVRKKTTLTPAQREAAIRRAQRLKKTFSASAELRPMAQQLLDNRTALAYAGVEAWARKHAGTDAGGLAWLGVGYAHYVDRE